MKNDEKACEKLINRVRSLHSEDCTQLTHLLPVEKLLLDVISSECA